MNERVARRVKERVVENHLVDRVKRLGGWCIKIVPVSQAGLPDRMVLLPGGRMRLAELKRPMGGRTAKLQEKVHQRLARLGHPVVVLLSTAEVDEWLDSL